MLSINSTRLDMKSVDVSVRFESLLCAVLSARMWNTHGPVREKDWKGILKRLVSAIEKSIQRTVTTDGFHRSQLDRYLGNLKEASKSKQVADIEVIHALVGIVFELLGGVPNYSRRRVINRQDDYVLTKLRTLHYSQWPWQKVNTILGAANRLPFSNYHKYDDLFYTYVRNYNGDAEGFINWYKKEYPDAYLEMF